LGLFAFCTHTHGSGSGSSSKAENFNSQSTSKKSALPSDFMGIALSKTYIRRAIAIAHKSTLNFIEISILSRCTCVHATCGSGISAILKKTKCYLAISSLEKYFFPTASLWRPICSRWPQLRRIGAFATSFLSFIRSPGALLYF
jgi:hypothetical protein